MKKVKNTGISFFQRDGVTVGNVSVTKNNDQKPKLSEYCPIAPLYVSSAASVRYLAHTWTWWE